MSILFCVSIAWFTVCVLFVGLGLIFLLILEHASDVSQATGADGGTIQKARELADTFDALAQLEDTVTLAPAILTADHAVAHRTQRTGAVIIRDPRLMRARNLSSHRGATEKPASKISVPQKTAAPSEAMEALSAEISHH